MMALARASLAALRQDEGAARSAFEEALRAARECGQKEWIWRILEARARLLSESGQSLLARRDIEEALGVLEEIAVRLPRDLREVYWDDARRRRLRDFAASRTSASAPSTPVAKTSAPIAPSQLQEDRLRRIL
jgi:hypothetical protein